MYFVIFFASSNVLSYSQLIKTHGRFFLEHWHFILIL